MRFETWIGTIEISYFISPQLNTPTRWVGLRIVIVLNSALAELPLSIEPTARNAN